jgi:hypothetical protein
VKFFKLSLGGWRMQVTLLTSKGAGQDREDLCGVDDLEVGF